MTVETTGGWMVSADGPFLALSGCMHRRGMGSDVMRPIVEGLMPPVNPDRDHWRGGAHAAVTLVECGDYERPYSSMAFRAIQRLEQQLGGQLQLVFRHYPLSRIDPHALAAASRDR
jgi:hypothetical protein